MAQKYSELSDKHAQFITEQKIYFVGTATPDSRVNISPKGMDSLRILDKHRVAWLNFTGSGNETASHVQESPRMTLMFCALSGNPLILRLYGNAKVIHHNDPEWEALYSLFEPIPGARQIFDLSIDLVQTSCGMGVPYFNYEGEREQLRDWALNKGEDGIKKYWQDKNQKNIDGIPSNIVEKNI
jgi:hypothetical protein